MLIGIFYTASNKQVRAQKFYEICQVELDYTISANDKELIDMFLKMQQIAYEGIIKVYLQHQQQVAFTADWIRDKQEIEDICVALSEIFLNTIFHNSSRLGRNEFVNKLTDNYKYLMPHALRQTIRGSIAATRRHDALVNDSE